MWEVPIGGTVSGSHGAVDMFTDVELSGVLLGQVGHEQHAQHPSVDEINMRLGRPEKLTIGSTPESALPRRSSRRSVARRPHLMGSGPLSLL